MSGSPFRTSYKFAFAFTLHYYLTGHVLLLSRVTSPFSKSYTDW